MPEIALLILSKRANRVIPRDEYVTVLINSAKRSLSVTLKSIKAHLCRWNQGTLEYDEDENGISNVTTVPAPNLKSKFEARAKELYDAISNQDVGQIVRLFDGKQLCTHVSSQSRAAFGIEFGAHPETELDYIRRDEAFRATLAGQRDLSEWATKIRGHLHP